MLRCVCRCVEGAYTFCPYLVPPKTFTSLAIPPVAEYINMWYCKYSQHPVSGGLGLLPAVLVRPFRLTYSRLDAPAAQKLWPHGLCMNP